MKHTEVQITVLDKENIIKYIPLIKKITNENIGGIREKALNDQPVVNCQYTQKPKELKQVYNLIIELTNLNAKIKISQNILGEFSRDIDLEIIENLIKRRKGIDEEEINIIENEVDD